MRSFVVLSVLSLLLLLAGFSVKQILLQGATPVSLAASQPLTGQVSQALVTSSDVATVPQAGTDYTLTGTKYFDNNTWAVTAIKGKSDAVTDGYALLQQRDGMFQVVLGPGTSFSNTIVVNLPTDVKQYLYQLGVVDGTI